MGRALSRLYFDRPGGRFRALFDGVRGFLLPHCRFRGLEADLGVSAIAEGLGSRGSAAAEGNARFAAQIVTIAVGVHQFEVFQPFNAIGAVLANRDLYLRHLLLLAAAGLTEY